MESCVRGIFAFRRTVIGRWSMGIRISWNMYLLPRLIVKGRRGERELQIVISDLPWSCLFFAIAPVGNELDCSAHSPFLNGRHRLISHLKSLPVVHRPDLITATDEGGQRQKQGHAPLLKRSEEEPTSTLPALTPFPLSCPRSRDHAHHRRRRSHPNRKCHLGQRQRGVRA